MVKMAGVGDCHGEWRRVFKRSGDFVTKTNDEEGWHMPSNIFADLK